MDLFEIGFVTVRLTDLLDILLVSLLLYKLYDILRGTLALRVAALIIGIFLLWKLVDLLNFRLLKSILDQFLNLGALALVVIFAPEIRKFLTTISKNTLIDRIVRQPTGHSDSEGLYQQVVMALKDIRATGNGALIVITGSDMLQEIQETGDTLDARVSGRLIFSIFQKESPLHDGAMIIHDNKIAAVRCILPVSRSNTLDPALGMRHRAALGLAEVSDALVIIVSEERREVSLALRGKLERNVDYSDIETAIERHFQQVPAVKS